MHDNAAASVLATAMSHGPAAADGGTLFRRLYSRAADPEAHIPGGQLTGAIRDELRTATGAGQSLGDLAGEAAAWSAAAARRFQAVGDRTGQAGRLLLTRRAALGCAPLGLASGAWLQWLTSPGDADLPLALRLLALYASDVGTGHPGAARGSAYLGLLRVLRVAENAVPLARLASDQRIADVAFRLPALLLLMSRRPDDFRPELAGADLCLRSAGLPPPLALARQELPGADWTAIDPSGTRADGVSPAGLCRAIADELAQAGDGQEQRVAAGFRWTLAALRSHADALHEELRASLDPGYDMAELMRLRAREGSVYHHRFLLEGRPLTAWLTDCRQDPRPFLDVLARSRLVKPGRSSASPLVSGLVSARGPMFRIFSPADLAIVSRWIDALPAEPGEAGTAGTAGTAAPAAGPVAGEQRLAVLGGLLAGGQPSGTRPAGLREAYHLLMRRTASPELRDWSLDYVHGWLARSRHRMGPGSVPLPRAWGAEGLRPWLQAQHDQHGAQFEEGAAVPLPSREAVIDDTVQTAPLTLIDGSWLAGFTDYELASSQIGHSLFATYWDELGNGEPGLNHPLIYRKVLKEMDIVLPPTASPEFARWPGFRDSSFELPVYWLCIGRFPRTFLPEVLGLNLAMELSGVGGSYRRAHLALREYGFSTRFVDIHNTIDNVATGHSAWAADAVDTFMASLPDSPGPGSQSAAWERVRTGYRSLNPPAGFGALRAARRGQSRRARLAPDR